MKNKKNKNSDNAEYTLVYSTDPIPEKRCSQCNQPVNACACKTHLTSIALKPVVRFERKGRGGKSVTLLERLPAHETLLEDLCAFLKRSLGAGGTFYIEKGEGVVEVQGDRRDQVKALVENYQSKSRNKGN